MHLEDGEQQIVANTMSELLVFIVLASFFWVGLLGVVETKGPPNDPVAGDSLPLPSGDLARDSLPPPSDEVDGDRFAPPSDDIAGDSLPPHSDEVPGDSLAPPPDDIAGDGFPPSSDGPTNERGQNLSFDRQPCLRDPSTGRGIALLNVVLFRDSASAVLAVDPEDGLAAHPEIGRFATQVTGLVHDLLPSFMALDVLARSGNVSGAPCVFHALFDFTENALYGPGLEIQKALYPVHGTEVNRPGGGR